MVVLHCNPEVLTSVVGFEASKVPAPLDRLFLPDQECTSENLGLMPEAMQSARRFAEARHQMNGTLIQSYRECLGMQILIHVLKKLNEYRTRHRDSKLRLRDVDRIHAARDFLMRDYVQPPSIRDLARRVGMNQTKLKVGFREVMRTSIYKFVLQCRMERAADLLKAGKHDIELHSRIQEISRVTPESLHRLTRADASGRNKWSSRLYLYLPESPPCIDGWGTGRRVWARYRSATVTRISSNQRRTFGPEINYRF
jgi:AraC-like DNA-binding protein